MITKLSFFSIYDLALLLEASLSTILIIVGIFFAILLLLGLRKSYILKKENERLEAMNNKINEETDKAYRDFTEGHIYGSDK